MTRRRARCRYDGASQRTREIEMEQPVRSQALPPYSLLAPVAHGWIPIFMLAWCCVSGCGSSPPADTTAPPDSCSEVTELFLAGAVLSDPDHACHDWLDAVHGRVARSSGASASVWTRRTEFQTAVITSAVHTLGVGFIGPAEIDIEESLVDPSAAENGGVARIRLIGEEGVDPDDRISPMFMLYNPAIPAEFNRNRLRDVPPRYDFFLAVVDSQKLESEPLLEVPGPLVNEPTPLYDPGDLTTTAPTYADPTPGSLVLMMGYANEQGFSGRLTAAVGRVLTDEEADRAIGALQIVGDEEGDIDYDAEVEMLIEGHAAGGMSGGGVFDIEGVLVGVIVRASESLEVTEYVRAVRMTFIVSELSSALDGLSADEQLEVLPYLDTSVAEQVTP